MKLIKAPKVLYQEISQLSKTNFTFLNKVGTKEYKELFYPVKCRDFLGDVLFSEKYKVPVLKYNFSYNPEESKIDRKSTLLGVPVGNEEIKKKILDNLYKLHEIEKKNGIKLTKVSSVSDTYLIFAGSTFWQSRLWLISLYTNIIRGLEHDINFFNYLDPHIKYDGYTELTYFSDLGKQKLEFLLNNLRNIRAFSNTIHGYKKDVTDLTNIHNNTGFSSLFSGNNYYANKNNSCTKRFNNAMQSL